jgi:hypothetical protein
MTPHIQSLAALTYRVSFPKAKKVTMITKSQSPSQMLSPAENALWKAEKINYWRRTRRRRRKRSSRFCILPGSPVPLSAAAVQLQCSQERRVWGQPSFSIVVLDFYFILIPQDT